MYYLNLEAYFNFHKFVYSIYDSPEYFGIFLG